MAGRLPGKPAYVWLWYATGGAMPEYSEYCGDLTPPAYQCNFGSSLGDCQQQVQAFLDKWYKDFNLVFTLTRPPTGDYYTVVITSGWDKCVQNAPAQMGLFAADLAGLAPAICNDNPGQTALAIECGGNAHDCANIIAHEHGHLVGLEHVASTSDVMYPTIRATTLGFDNQSDAIQGDDICDERTQNSYQQMLTALGAWPGGAKPALTIAIPDGGAPDVAPPDAGTRDAGAPDTALPDVSSRGIPDAGTPDARAPDASTPDASTPDAASPDIADAPTSGTGQGSGADVNVGVLPGFDAYARTLPTMPDAPTATPEAPHGGCSIARSPSSTSRSFTVALLLACFLLARRSSHSRVAARPRRGTPRRA